MKLFSRVVDDQCNINKQVGFTFWSTTAFSLIFWSVCVWGEDCLPILYHYNPRVSKVSGITGLSFEFMKIRISSSLSTGQPLFHHAMCMGGGSGRAIVLETVGRE